MFFAPVRFGERRACGLHHFFFHIEFHRVTRHGSYDCLPRQKSRRCTYIRSDNERQAFCARTILDDGRASGLLMLIDSKIAFCFINRPLPNSRRRLQMPVIYHPIASQAARRYHSAKCMNVIQSVAANPNKRFERTADAGRKDCDITIEWPKGIGSLTLPMATFGGTLKRGVRLLCDEEPGSKGHSRSIEHGQLRLLASAKSTPF